LAINMAFGINNAVYCAISRRIFALERKARFLSATPENQFTYTSTNGIDGHQRLSLRPKIFIERLHDQELTTLERIVFDGGDHSSDDPSELHPVHSTVTSSITPTIAASTGASFIFCAKRALEPATTSTRS